MALKLSILLLCFIAISPIFVKDFHYVKVKKLECKFEYKYFYENGTCFAKPMSRNSTSLTGKFWMKKPFVPINVSNKKILLSNVNLLCYIQLEVIFYYRYGTIFREVMKTPKLDLCALTSLAVSNPLMTEIFKALNDSSPGIIHKCPYDVVNIENTVLKIDQFAQILPEGTYRGTFNWTNKKGGKILFIQSIATITSSDKNSFG